MCWEQIILTFITCITGCLTHSTHPPGYLCNKVYNYILLLQIKHPPPNTYTCTPYPICILLSWCFLSGRINLFFFYSHVGFPWVNEIYLVLMPEIADTMKYFEVQDKQQANLQVVLTLTKTFSMRNWLSSYVAKYCLWYSFWEQRNSSNVCVGSGKACICLKEYTAFFVGFQGFIGLCPQYIQESASDNQGWESTQRK